MRRGGGKKKGGKKKGKKKGSKKKSASSSAADATTTTSRAESRDTEEVDAGELLMKRGKRRWETDVDAAHTFWDTQPVPTLSESIVEEENGPMEEKLLIDVRKDPLTLPSAFEWVSMDLRDTAELEELYELLRDHYVEDDDAMFRFNYSTDFLRWALCVPEYKRDFHIGIRHVATGTLMAFISGIPAQCHVKGKEFPIVEINFLCVHEKLRGKRLAPVLIKEVTRRVNCTGVWQATFTAGVTIPKPIASTRYWHRSLNPLKLMDIGFSSSRKRISRLALKKLYSVASETSLEGLRPLRESDCAQTHKLLVDYLSKFPYRLRFTLADFKHFFLPRDNVIYAYVVAERVKVKVPVPKTIVDESAAADGKTEEECAASDDQFVDKVTDFVSFYNLPSQVMKHEHFTEMRAAYSYYNVPGKYSLKELISNALILAQKEKFDLYNCLNVMDNEEFLSDKSLKFGIGDGHLQYYVYNWKTAEIKASDVAVVLV